MTETNEYPQNDRKETFGWMMYDWANSGFFTVVISVLIGPYLLGLASNAVGENGVVFDLGVFTVTAKGLAPFCTAISTIALVPFLPIFGAIADYTHLKKKLMALFTYIGVAAGASMFFITESYLLLGVLLILSTMVFAAANVFYNAFLIDIATEDRRDKISSYGYGLGYAGGVAILLATIVLLSTSESFGMSKGMAVRVSLLAASLWWGVFGAVSFALLKSRAPEKTVETNESLLTVGFKEVWMTIKELGRLRYTRRFLIAYLFYNDGIQTVILQSSVFMSYELFTSKNVANDDSFLLVIFLIAQVSALAGALIFERIARVVGAKATIMVSLVIWCGVVIYAYGFFQTKIHAYIIAAFIGMVLGSAQALSRSLYSQMIPKGRESSFFGLYEISEKGTSWMGQLLFTIIVSMTGSFRQALLGLIVFFVGGIVILWFTDTKRAIHEAGNLTPEEAAGAA